MNLYFLFSVLLLAFLLFFPTSKLILVFSIRRLEKKTASKLTEDEIQGQYQRARLIAVIVVLIFSCLFNISLGINPRG
ncbi:MAG: hypothetical protein R8G33_06855 [Gammaproteobacteria bacterium]|nr:hypothetical protein [Gammaproteobacteria bacterium]